MHEKPRKSGKAWTAEEIGMLTDMSRQGASAAALSAQLNRSIGAIQQKALEIGVTLARSPHRPRRPREPTAGASSNI